MIKNELELLNLLEEEEPINLQKDLKKVTDDTLKQIAMLRSCPESGEIITPIPLQEKIVKEVRYFNKNKMRIDGTKP